VSEVKFERQHENEAGITRRLAHTTLEKIPLVSRVEPLDYNEFLLYWKDGSKFIVTVNQIGASKNSLTF
jgi:hypothetical protein